MKVRWTDSNGTHIEVECDTVEVREEGTVECYRDGMGTTQIEPQDRLGRIYIKEVKS